MLVNRRTFFNGLTTAASAAASLVLHTWDGGACPPCQRRAATLCSCTACLLMARAGPE